MKFSTKKDLDEAILALEKKKVMQHNLMLKKYELTTERLTPKNLIKGAFSNVTHSSEAMGSIMKTIAGVSMGLITKRLFIGRSTTLLKKLLGNAIRIGVAKTTIGNSNKIKAYGTAIYHQLFNKNHKEKI